MNYFNGVFYFTLTVFMMSSIYLDVGITPQNHMLDFLVISIYSELFVMVVRDGRPTDM